ncbi:MAG TPA: 3-hydroxyacyl-CoA dehydrogenase family protein [Aquamicrobium sp.]|nr:3-hydroxyacyl-CoA dehydrogenase family protein [Aquamicrobium sp.]
METQDKPGFILNALLVPFNNDVIRAIEAGVASPADIDKAIKIGLGYKMGPCELLDLIGLDTQVRLCEAFYPVTLDPRASAPPLLRRMVAAGRLGRKSGRGFYDYEQK